MFWFFEMWEELRDWLPYFVGIVGFVATLLCVAWVLMTKSEASSAIAWILLIFFLPFVGIVLFFLFGYQHVNRPLQRKRRHKLAYERPANPPNYDSTTLLRPATQEGHLEGLGESIARLAYRLGGYHLTEGNRIDFYTEGLPAFEAM